MTSRQRIACHFIAVAWFFLSGSYWTNLQAADEATVRVAVFDVDATPPLGAAMAYDPVRRLDELTLRCRGVVLLGADAPIVLCAVDWIGIANEGQDAFRDALAEAAGTTRERVAVHTLHQHDAPGCDFTAEAIIRDLGLTNAYGRFDGTFHREVIRRTADEIKRTIQLAQPVTHYGFGVAEVKEVASNRRILGPDGRVRATRYTATRDPELRAEPEGVIDPQVSLLSFWTNETPIALLSYYACHPQSYYRLGIPSPDFPGIARFIRGQAVPEALHVHFNGAGGNIGAGKYNDGARENRMVLAQKLAEGMKQAWEATKKQPLTAKDLGWKVDAVQLAPAPHLIESELVEAIKSEPPRGYIAKVDQLAWLRRTQAQHKIDIACLQVGKSRVVHMPGELFVEYQLAAKKLRPDLNVCMAAYGEYGPGYIGTAIAYTEGGYETSARASNVAASAEQVLIESLERVLEVPALPMKENFHLYLLVGQSNMAGRGTVEASDQQAHPRVVTLHASGDWVPAIDPLHFDKPTAVGVGLGKVFAEVIAEANPQVTIGLIPCAVGGSPIDSWQPGVHYPPTNSHPWDDALARAKQAMKYGVLKGILWHQGESDCTETLAPEYEKKLHDLVARLRGELNAPDVPFLVGQMGQFPEKPWTEHQKRVDQAHRLAAEKLPQVAFVPADGLKHKGDEVHFDAEGYRELGRRFAAAWQKMTSAPPQKEKQEKPQAAVPQDGNAFLEYVRRKASDLRGKDTLPESLDQWQERRQEIRRELMAAWGGFPGEPVPLEPKILETLERDGYRIEKLIFQTFPGVWMTANAYVPESSHGGKKVPAVLCVHGHWSGAKQDPHVQARCIGLAKLGFFVLAVDAFGAGERGIGKALGEYHGEMVAATLLPLGRPLSGIQVYENGRAVDYLQSRPEVDGEKLGITGASGGGNQSMYAGAWDERFKAVVPVCSVGNYQAYLGTACCMCEVVPGALAFTEEAGVLGLTAPRALMVINATRDGIQFSVGEAKKSLASVEPIFRLYDREGSLRHAVFESPHDYNQPMREAMYGWMTKHLKNEGDGSPIAEATLALEDPETLRCFRGDRRPDDWLTLPQFAAREGKRVVAGLAVPTDVIQCQKMAEEMKTCLKTKVLRCENALTSKLELVDGPDASAQLSVDVEPGIRLTGEVLGKLSADRALRIVLQTDGPESTPASGSEQTQVTENQTTLILPLRATGKQSFARDKVGRAPDHNTAEWSLWLGRPLLGQWVDDVRATLDALAQRGLLAEQLTIEGKGAAGVVALCAAALDSRIDQVEVEDSLASYISDTPYEGQRLGIMAPGILRQVGDIQHLAALIAPRPLRINSAVRGNGETLAPEEQAAQFDFTRKVYVLHEAEAALQLSSAVKPVSEN